MLDDSFLGPDVHVQQFCGAQTSGAPASERQCVWAVSLVPRAADGLQQAAVGSAWAAECFTHCELCGVEVCFMCCGGAY